jgi:phospholipid/cholesterol/gamma-HCH transport system substrate-binding protein
MEIKARYRLIGLFMLAVIGIGFGFVYWLQNAGGLAERKAYQIRFDGTVGGLQVGAPVQFDGIRVGEVTKLVLDADDPRVIIVTIGIDRSTPLRADTSIRIDYQGLTGSAAVALNGGSAQSPKLNLMTNPPVLVAPLAAGQGLTDMARDVLSRLDKLFGDNSADLHDTIGNLKTFSAALAKNSGKIDTILGGLEKTFSAPTKPVMAIYDLAAPNDFPALTHPPQAQLAVADLTTILNFDTQQILIKPKQGATRALENAQWSDSLPKLIQEKIIQSFENAHYIGAVSRPLEGLSPDYQLLIDLRAFDIALAPAPHAEFDFVAKILSKDGKIVGARLIHADAAIVPESGTGNIGAAAAAAALNTAFGKAAKDLVAWTSPLVFANKPAAAPEKPGHGPSTEDEPPPGQIE